MELYCVDVGQGTCNVLVLRNRRAVVIDCGPRTRELLTVLIRCRIERIERLIISHNDADHSGGAAALLDEYRNRIGQIWFVQDSRLLTTTFWKKLNEEVENGYLKDDQCVRLEVGGYNQPRRIFEDSAESLTLKVFAPTYVSVVRSVQKKTPNASSGIVVMDRGSRVVVFSGDAGAAEWKKVYDARKSKLVCGSLAVFCPPPRGQDGQGGARRVDVQGSGLAPLRGDLRGDRQWAPSSPQGRGRLAHRCGCLGHVHPDYRRVLQKPRGVPPRG